MTAHALYSMRERTRMREYQIKGNPSSHRKCPSTLVERISAAYIWASIGFASVDFAIKRYITQSEIPVDTR